MRRIVVLLAAATAAAGCQTAKTQDEMSIASKGQLAFPLGEPNDTYAQYFSGQSYLAPRRAGGRLE